jgi:hypothetical protein
MPKKMLPTGEKHDMYKDFDRKSFFKGKTKENGSIKDSVFEKNIRTLFCGIEE